VSTDLHSDPERLQEDLAGYVLGALDPQEASALELHLEGCESCRERLGWLHPAVDLLPASVEQVSPPDSLRESLMATVRAEAAAEAPAGASARSAPRRQRRSWWQGLGPIVMRPATGFAAALLLVAGVATGYLVRGDDGSGPQSTFVEAKPTRGTPPGASATLERHGDSATLHVTQLPELSRREVYEVWIQRAGVMEPASTFVVAADGSAEAAVPGPLKGAEGVYVTAEPHPGTRQPTSPPVLAAQLQ
jgi:hypothetical protein